MSINNTITDSEVPARFDRHGTPITTTIGKYYTGSMRKSMKNRKSLMNSDTGAADIGSPEKKPEKRYRVTFMDEVSGDKS